MACLETTFLVDVLRGEPRIKDLLHAFARMETATVAAPTVMELWSGAMRAGMSEKEQEKIELLLESLLILPLEEHAAKMAGEIEASLLSKGEMIDIEDIMIAAIAITNGEKLVSRDRDYARIPHLRLEKY